MTSISPDHETDADASTAHQSAPDEPRIRMLVSHSRPKPGKRRAKSAGGILIDPWDSLGDFRKYKIIIVNQRIGQYWGLPKGHVEDNEDVYRSAIRELREETGIDLDQLEHGTDYVPIRLHKQKNFYNHVVIKKIHFFAFLLLRRGHLIPRYPYDMREICDFAWTELDKLEDLTASAKCNRTLSDSARGTLWSICRRTQRFITREISSDKVRLAVDTH